VEKIRKKQLNS